MENVLAICIDVTDVAESFGATLWLLCAYNMPKISRQNGKNKLLVCHRGRGRGGGHT